MIIISDLFKLHLILNYGRTRGKWEIIVNTLNKPRKDILSKDSC